MDKNYHHLHLMRHIHLWRWLHDKYNDLVISDSFRHLALAMISLFIPIFLLKLGYSLLTVAVLDLGMCLVGPAAHYLCLVYIHRWGVKKALAISYALNIILYILLYKAVVLSGLMPAVVFLAVIAFFNIAAATVYWTAHHIYFFRSTKAEEVGRKVGLLFAIPALVGIISPFLGSLLITSFGFSAAFLVSAILLSAAAAALSLSDNIEVPERHLGIRETLDLGNMKKNLIYFIQGISFHATAFFWPIFLFLSAVKLTSIGLLYLGSSLAYSITAYICGRITDNHGGRRIAIIGATGRGLSLIFRGLSPSIAFMAIWQTFGGLFNSLYHIPLEAGYYKYSWRHDFINETMNRELYMYLGRSTTIIFFIIIFFYFPTPTTAITATMIFAGICTLLINLIIKNDHSIISS